MGRTSRDTDRDKRGVSGDAYGDGDDHRTERFISRLTNSHTIRIGGIRAVP